MDQSSKHGSVYCLLHNNEGEVYSGHGDGSLRIWDISTGKPVRSYEPPKPQEVNYRVQACFNFNESGVMSSFHNDVIIWDTRMSSISHQLSGHIKPVRWIASSSVAHSFMSCSEDLRARFWNGE